MRLEGTKERNQLNGVPFFKSFVGTNQVSWSYKHILLINNRLGVGFLIQEPCTDSFQTNESPHQEINDTILLDYKQKA
jgi:hypothetical protein